MSIGQAPDLRGSAFKKEVTGRFMNGAYALGLTVPHKTVAERN